MLKHISREERGSRTYSRRKMETSNVGNNLAFKLHPPHPPPSVYPFSPQSALKRVHHFEKNQFRLLVVIPSLTLTQLHGTRLAGFPAISTAIVTAHLTVGAQLLSTRRSACPLGAALARFGADAATRVAAVQAALADYRPTLSTVGHACRLAVGGLARGAGGAEDDSAPVNFAPVVEI